MAASIHKRASARRDLTEHYVYLAGNAVIEIAERFLVNAEKRFGDLARHPGMGVALPGCATGKCVGSRRSSTCRARAACLSCVSSTPRRIGGASSECCERRTGPPCPAAASGIAARTGAESRQARPELFTTQFTSDRMRKAYMNRSRSVQAGTAHEPAGSIAGAGYCAGVAASNARYRPRSPSGSAWDFTSMRIRW